MMDTERKLREEACYTCLRKGRVKQTIVRELEHGFISFDLIGRPLMVYTPWKHVEDLSEVDSTELKAYHEEIHTFMRDHGYSGYQVLQNFGTWVTHAQKHFHLKVAADEASVRRHRRNHMEGCRGASLPDGGTNRPLHKKRQ